MIQLSYPKPLVEYQLCYLSISEGTTGLHLLSGPHILAPDGSYVHMCTTNIQAGSLYRDPDALSIRNEHPILHHNVKGDVKVSFDSLRPPSAYMMLWPDIHKPYVTGSVIGMSDCKGSFGGYQSPSVRGFRVGTSTNMRCDVIYGGYIPYHRLCSLDKWYGDYHYITSLTEDSPTHFSYVCKCWWRGQLTRDTIREFSVDLSSPKVLPDQAGYSVPVIYSETNHLTGKVSTWSGSEKMIATTPSIHFTGVGLEAVRNTVLGLGQRVYTIDPPDDVPWGTLVKDAVQSIRYISSNSIENAAGFKDIKSNLPPIRAVKRLVSQKDPRALAEIYLWYKYSFSPNLSDGKEIFKAARKKSRRYVGAFYRSQIFHSFTDIGSGTVNHECRANVKFAVSDYRDAQMRIASWGLDPGIAQGWDLIPFSFVVDWFFHVGDKLSNFDWEFDNFVNSYQYESITYSIKSELPINLPSSLTGSLTAIRYERIISNSIPFAYAIQSNSAPSHILEGAALIVTNLGN